MRNFGLFNALAGLLLATAATHANAAQVGASEIERCSAWLTPRTSRDLPEVRVIGTRTVCADLGAGMTREIVERFIHQLNRVPLDQAPQVVVRSIGGEVDNGMTIGEAILDRRAEVHVFGFCASSCANYLFLAGAKRHVMPESVVFFHGGLVAASARNGELTDVGRIRIKQSLARQARFLKRAGIDDDFFEAMDALNSDSGAANACPGMSEVSALVLSDHRLSAAGALVEFNEGPHSQAEVEHVMARYDLADTSCFWR